jgi:hypothetical protein
MLPGVRAPILPVRMERKEIRMSFHTWFVAMLAGLALSSAVLAAPGGNSSATISAAFANSCRGFTAHSSKDISHVVLHYADGRDVKHENVGGPDYAIEGGTGDALEFAIVKSAITRQLFECTAQSSPPVARLEILTPAGDGLDGCFDFGNLRGDVHCEQSTPRVAWTPASRVPEGGFLTWICGGASDPSQCSFTITFRGIASSDPDGDIVSWSLDFGDGTSVSGSWGVDPPAEVAHTYSRDLGGVITLTVTDAAGQSGSESMRMAFLDTGPD